MAEDTKLILIEVDDESAAAAVKGGLPESVRADARVIKKQALDGDPIAWTVVITTALTQLPAILNAISRLVRTARGVRRVKVGDEEIDPKSIPTH